MASMGDFTFDLYQQPLYLSHAVQEATSRPSSMLMNPHDPQTGPGRLLFTDIPRSHPLDSYRQSHFDATPLNIFGPVSYGAQDFCNPHLLPMSMNPSASLPPSAFLSPSPTPEYGNHSPMWSNDGCASLAYRSCDRQIPVQMPELGYESSSPVSDGAPYPRITLSESPLPKIEQSEERSPTDATTNFEEDSENADPCYAELLRQCLLEAPEFTMSLRELYAWMAEHSPKAKDPKNTGWKNSVRHNLSMNQVAHGQIPSMH